MRKLNFYVLAGILFCMFLAGCGNGAPDSESSLDKFSEDTLISEIRSAEGYAKIREEDEPDDFTPAEFTTTFSEAASVDDLIVGVYMGKSTQYLHLWKKDDLYYLFLPASAEQISFVNLGAETELVVGERVLSKDTLVLEKEGWMMGTNPITFKKGEDFVTCQLCIMQSDNIPTLFIEIDVDQNTLDAYKGIEYSGSMELVTNEGELEYTGLLKYIRTRGNTTFSGSDKKAYQIKTAKKSSLLNMPVSKKWILLANEDDNTYLWNSLVYDFANDQSTIGASEGDFVDVYINGAYRGNYYLCQKIDNAVDFFTESKLEEENDKVEIIEGKSEYGCSADGTAVGITNRKSPEDITGAYLIEAGPIGQLDTVEKSYFIFNDFAFTIQSPSNATLEEVLYVKNLVMEIYDALKEADGVNPTTGKHYSEYIDVDSFVEKYLIDLVFTNADAGASMFFYKESDSIDTKLYAGPVWDYDKAYYDYYSVEKWDNYDASFFMSDLLSHDSFVELCEKRFEECYKPYVKYTLSSDLYNLYKKQENSFKMNFVRWNSPNLHNNGSSFMDTILYKCKERLNIIEETVFEENNIHKVAFSGGTVESSSYRQVEDGATIDNIPVPFSYAGVFVHWVREDNGEVLYHNTPIYEDVRYVAEYLSLDLIILNGETIAGIAVENLVPEHFEYAAEYIRKQQAKE